MGRVAGITCLLICLGLVALFIIAAYHGTKR
jgi:hypothetical protein